MTPDDRANAGVFLAFQHPLEIPGVNLGSFLFTLFKAKNPTARAVQFHTELPKLLQQAGVSQAITERSLNVGLSGGEKKRVEILQMLLIKPRFAILDETDSGLDIDSLKVIANAVNTLRSPQFGALVVTHYNRILEHLKPDHVHVLIDGKIAMSGTASLPQELEKKGYTWLKEEVVHG